MRTTYLGRINTNINQGPYANVTNTWTKRRLWHRRWGTVAWRIVIPLRLRLMCHCHFLIIVDYTIKIPPHPDQRDMTNAHMHSQRESKLLSAPAEIRRAIYANIIPSQIHAFLSQGRIQLSGCLQPNLGDDFHDGREREIRGEESSQAKWARRLRSSWGPHWECEQVALAENTDLHEHGRNYIYNLLFVCKKM